MDEVQRLPGKPYTEVKLSDAERECNSMLVKQIAELQKALEAAERFISNGIEFGYITMPDPETQDPAHETLPMIRMALARLKLSHGS